MPFTPFPALTYNATETCGPIVYRRSKRSLACRSNYGKGGKGSGSGSGSNNGGDYNNGGNGGKGGDWNGHHYPEPTPSNMCEVSAGSNVVLTAAAGNSTIPAGSFLTFVSGLDVVSVPGTVSGSNIAAQIPAVAAGQTYVFITSAAAAGALDSTTVVAGPAIVEGKFCPGVLCERNLKLIM